MNIVVTCFDDKEEFIKPLENIINRLKPKKCFIFGYNEHKVKHFQKISNTEIIYINEYDIYFDRFNHVDWTSLDPLDKDFVKKMSSVETEVFWMMTRFSYGEFSKGGSIENKFRINQFYDFEDLSYYKRKRIYLDYLRYWYNFYKKNDIDLLIEGCVPHIAWEYVGYKVAKIFNVRTIQLSFTPVKRVYLVIDSYEIRPEKFISVYENIINTNLTTEDIDLTFNDSKQEWERLVQPSEIQELPDYEVKNRKFNLHLSRGQRLLKKDWNSLLKSKTWWKYQVEKVKVFSPNRLRHFDGWTYLFKGLNRSTGYENKLFKFYERNCREPDYNIRYIYFPLHFQPELSTSPLGGTYSDQLLVVQLLAASVPPGFEIFVKDHPMQRYRNRDIEFYQRLLEIPNVRLISRSKNSYKLLESCFATASITGTAGWEGLFKGKPYLMFGNYFYRYIKGGVYYIESFEGCKQAIQSIVSNYPTINRKHLKAFIKAFEETGIRVGYFGHTIATTKDESKRLTEENVTRGYLEKIDEIMQSV